MAAGMTISEASEELGLTAHTLRYYEKAGLLRSVPRTEGGLRRYEDQDVQMLRFLTRLRATGMPIQQVRAYAELVREGKHTVAACRKLLDDHRRNVISQISDLNRNLAILDLKIDMYERGVRVSESPDDPCAIKLRELMERKS